MYKQERFIVLTWSYAHFWLACLFLRAFIWFGDESVVCRICYLLIFSFDVCRG